MADINARDIRYSSSSQQLVDAMTNDTVYYSIMIVMILIPLGAVYGLKFAYALFVLALVDLGYSLYVVIEYGNIKQEAIDFINTLPVPDALKKSTEEAVLQSLSDQMGIRCYALLVVGLIGSAIMIYKGVSMMREKKGKGRNKRI